MTEPESVFTYGAPALKFGDGASDEIGYDLAQLGARRALVDHRPAAWPPPACPQRVAEQMAPLRRRGRGLSTACTSSPPTPACRPRSTGRATHGPWDAFVAVGGGSSIDTAKAVNLLLTNPGELLDYVNAPVGGGPDPVNALLPLVAVPTTTGTGSESTTVCVLDVLAQRVKSSHLQSR